MTPTEPIDPTRFHEFEQAGWQRAAEHYGETFGSLTVRTIPSLLDAVGFGIVLQAIEQHGVVDVGLPAGPPFFRFSDTAECVRSLEAAGFVRPEVRRLPLVWQLSSPEGLFEAVTRGGVRTAALLRAQTPGALKNIAVAINERVGTYQRDGVIELPMSAVLASAVKP